MTLVPLQKIPEGEIKPRPGDLPFFGHLEELRSRLILCLAAVGICFVACYAYARPIFNFLMKPVLDALGHDLPANLYFTSLTEPFINDLKVALFAAIFFSLPVIFYQIWKFISPALHRNEKSGLLTLTTLSAFFFLAGMAFAYYVFFPMSFSFFLSFSSTQIRPLLTIGTYLNFTMHILFVFGLIFELPLVILVLAWSGVVSGPQVLRFWRYAIVIISIFSAVLSPGPDVASMLLMMVPMTLLYFTGVIFAYIFGYQTAKEAQNI